MVNLEDVHYYDSDETTSDYYEENNDGYDGNKKYYSILTEADIRQRQVEHIDTVSSVLSITKEAASVLLRYYRWSTRNVNEAWFSNEEKVRKHVGLLLDVPVVNSQDSKWNECPICYEKKRADKFRTTGCGHIFCLQCWKLYLGTSINGGPECLTLRCPAPYCGFPVPQDMINRLVSDLDKAKYERFLVRSYPQGHSEIKWCPTTGCEHAIEYNYAGLYGSKNGYDVMCRCLNGFCWNCKEDAHRPVDCDTVAKWIMKSKAESKSTMWILAYTKPCPKCKRSIEKNKGGMHMTCPSPCGFQFCWLCLKSWSGHKGFYECNHYEKAKKKGTLNEEEKRINNAKNAIVRYTHYYERWETNDKSRKKAIEDLHEMETENLERLSCILSEPMIQLEFITKAWVQIVECRRVLKWTYAYGYYLPEKEKAKKELFEYLQGEAEAGLERLHHCAETELNGYLQASKRSESFADFRVKLKGLTSVTETYFKNLVNALEGGLSEVKELDADKPPRGFKDFSRKLKELKSTTITYFQKMVKALEDGLSNLSSG